MFEPKTVFKKNFLILIFIILLMVQVQANELYADIEIRLNQRGDAIITGVTNHPTLIGTYKDMTSKQEQYWLFNLTKENFTSALFRIDFPEDVIITYIRSTARINIGADDAPFIKGTLRNKPLEIIVQYYFDEPSEVRTNYLQIIISTILILLGIYIMFFHKKKKESIKEEKGLSERQKKIIELLGKKDGVTQKYIEEKLNLPKSSISRNISTLERKGIIKKITKGFSNTIYLNKNK